VTIFEFAVTLVGLDFEMSVSSTRLLNIFAAQISARNRFALFCVEATTEEVFRLKTEGQTSEQGGCCSWRKAARFQSALQCCRSTDQMFD